MSIDLLVPLETLSRVKADLDARIARSIPDIDPGAGAVGEALAWSLLFERWPELLPGPLIDHQTAFYNRYFWFKRFVLLRQAREGFDAGLEQQAFRLLEQPGFELDWSLMEALEAEAADPRGPA